MKITLYACDRCGMELDPGTERQVLGFDFCPECAEEAIKVLKNWTKAGPDRKVDWGAAQALRDAGWTIEKIAKELGVSNTSVHRNTTRPKAKKTYEHESPESDPAILKSPGLV